MCEIDLLADLGELLGLPQLCCRCAAAGLDLPSSPNVNREQDVPVHGSRQRVPCTRGPSSPTRSLGQTPLPHQGLHLVGSSSTTGGNVRCLQLRFGLPHQFGDPRQRTLAATPTTVAHHLQGIGSAMVFSQDQPSPQPTVDSFQSRHSSSGPLHQEGRIIQVVQTFLIVGEDLDDGGQKPPDTVNSIEHIPGIGNSCTDALSRDIIPSTDL